MLCRSERRKQLRKTCFSEHCEPTEDKQGSRSVASSRKTVYCTGISQSFEPRDVGCLPGVVQWEHGCRELSSGHRPYLEPKTKLQSKDV